MAVKLKAPFDLDFLRSYGAVFKVFDDQDSGNLCFGVASNAGERYFVKFVGAPTVRYSGDPREAIERLKASATVYSDLAHPSLIRFVKAEEVGGGYAIVFEWTDAICAGRQYPSSREAFIELPLEARVRVFEDVMEFHEHVARRGYVAIDFYDGSIMYDQVTGGAIVCDIDFYQKSPYAGSMGLWGSTRFISPEERTDGAVIDEVTNVYTMGATAFALFADSDRSVERWPLGMRMFETVKRAASDEREMRHQSIRELIEEWESAKQADSFSAVCGIRYNGVVRNSDNGREIQRHE